jgi:hypothetical protein
MRNLEHMLWDAVTGKQKVFAAPKEIEQLNHLSGKCGGWIIWDQEAKGERFLPMQEWLRLCEANRPKTSK